MDDPSTLRAYRRSRLDPLRVDSTLIVVVGLATPLSIYLPGLPGFLPLSVVLALVLAARVGIGFDSATGVPLLALALVYFVAVFWSSDVQQCVAVVFYVVLLVIMLGVGRRLVKHDVMLLASAWACSGLIDAVLVILFRAYPDFEIDWLQWNGAGLFINPSVVGKLFTEEGYNNVLDPLKSGAFFVNANAGSAFLGTAMMVAIWLASATGRALWLVPAAIFGVAVVASGSTTGLVLLALILSLAVGRWLLKTAIGLVMAPLVALAALASAAGWWASSVDSSLDLEIRELLWRRALEAVYGNPLTGLGFGGWETYGAAASGAVGTAGIYPPHNLFLTAAVNAGVVPAILIAVFVAALLLKLAQRDGSFLITGAFLWTVLHSMGDNTSLLSDYHTLPVLGCLIGFVLQEWRSTEEEVCSYERRSGERAVEGPAGRPGAWSTAATMKGSCN